MTFDPTNPNNMPSRSRRSQASGVTQRALDAGGPSVRSQDFARDVSGEGATKIARGQAFHDLGQVLRSFTVAARFREETDHQQRLFEIRKEVADDIKRLEDNILADREGAREAVKTGDYSGFIREDATASTELQLRAFNATSGRLFANQDLHQLQTLVENVPAGGNVEGTIDSFIEEQTKGANPDFTAEYRQYVINNSRRMVAGHQQSTQLAHAQQSTSTVVREIQGGISSGDYEASSSGYAAMKNQLIAVLPGHMPQRVLDAVPMLDSVIIGMAASGDENAQKMMLVQDEHGRTVADRNPGAYQNAVDDYVEAQKKVKTSEAWNSIEAIKDERQNLMASRSYTLEDAQRLYLDTLTKVGENAGGKPVDDLQDTLVADITRLSQAASGAQDIYAGTGVVGTDKDFEATREQVETDLASGNLSSEQTLTAIGWLGRVGSSKAQQQRLSNALLSSDHGAAMGAFSYLNSLWGASGGDMSKHLADPKSLGIFMVMRDMAEAGEDPAAYLQKMRDNPIEGDIDTWLSRQKDANGETIKPSVMAEAGSSLLKAAEEDPSFGLDPDNNFFFSDLEWGTLPNEVRSHMTKVLNRAAAVLGIADPNDARVQSLAKKMLKNDLSSDMELVDGEWTMVPALNRVPGTVVDPVTGKLVQGQKVTRDTMRTFENVLGLPSVKRNMELYGEVTALKQDRLTQAGEGFAVTTSPDGFPETVIAKPGQRIVDENGLGISHEYYEANKDLFDKFYDVEVRDNDVVLSVPQPEGPVDRIYLGDGFFWSYDARANAWSMRWGNAESVTEEVDQKVEEATTKPRGFAGSPGRGRHPEGAIGSPTAPVMDRLRSQNAESIDRQKREAEVHEDAQRRGADIADDPLGLGGFVGADRHPAPREGTEGRLDQAQIIKRGDTTHIIMPTADPVQLLEGEVGEGVVTTKPGPVLKELEAPEAQKPSPGGLGGRGGSGSGDGATKPRKPMRNPRGPGGRNRDRKVKMSVLRELKERLVISGTAVAKALNNIDMELPSLVKAAMADTRQETGFIADATLGLDQQFMPKVMSFIEKHEGRRRMTYDDLTGRTVSSGVVSRGGNPTVGVGFNLNRKDARAKLTAVGADYDAVRAGRQALSTRQVDALFATTVREELAWLRKRLGDSTYAALPGYRLQALVSLSFNSRKLIGPKLTAAIKAGDWAAAEHEIRNNSNNGKQPANVKRGLQARRELEADMFMGWIK